MTLECSDTIFAVRRQAGVRAWRRAAREAAGALLDLAVVAPLVWAERRRQRRHLGELGDHLLRDIGLDRATAAHEAAKPFWRR